MVKILAICGFGVGTSLILRMNIEKVLKENNLEAEVEHIDVTTAAGAAADLIVAKFTPVKNIFLTGHIYFWTAYLAVAAGVQGGRGAAVVTSAVSGVVMILLVMFSIGVTLDTAAGFNQLYGGDDFSVFSGISSLISNLF